MTPSRHIRKFTVGFFYLSRWQISWSLLMGFGSAQEMPDTIWGFAGSDTVSLAIHEGFSGGWSIRLFYRSGSWREVSRETLLIDTMPHLLQWTRYCQPPFEKPCQRIDFTYLTGRLYYTLYRYNEPIFKPLQRLYLWGLSPTRTENLLFSEIAEALWPAAPDTLHPIWPFPRQWKRTHWPDSTLSEIFDAAYEIFIEAGGFHRLPDISSCDSTRRYTGAFWFPVSAGRGILCFPDGERLAFARDSLCDTNFCWIIQREVSYAGGLPAYDTARVFQRLLSGQLVASAQFAIRYQYDVSGRLVEVLAPQRRYRLSYSGKVLSIPQSPLSGPTITHSSMGRWVRLENLPHPATVRLYDLAGNLMWTAEGLPEGTHFLPSNLQGAYLLQISSLAGFIWQRLILLP